MSINIILFQTRYEMIILFIDHVVIKSACYTYNIVLRVLSKQYNIITRVKL